MTSDAISSTEQANRAVASRPVQWVALGVALALCVGILHVSSMAFHVSLGRFEPASVILQASPVKWVMMLLVTLLCGCFVATSLTRSHRRDAGIFCAFLSVAWLSTQGASLREALLAYGSPKTYLLLAGECCTLGGIAVAVIGVFDALTSDWRIDDDLVDEFTASDNTMPAKILAFLLTLVLYMVLLMILAQTDRKAQVIAATLAGGFLSTIIAHFILPVKPSNWYFAAPLVGGVIGNLLVYTIDPSGWELGLSRSWASPLARALPIDHFSCGIAGSILGYWASRRTQVEANEDTH